jgi:two-component system, chemotaxis family, chemotaxis protein CheY
MRSTSTRRADHRSTVRILVADADDDIRACYRESFERAGCDVVDVSDGRDALVQAFMHPPMLVVTEIGLKFVDGYALCEILRHDRTTGDIPILVVTDECRPAQMDRARRAGADVVLVKPTSIEHVLKEMRRLVAGSSSRRKRALAPTRNIASRCDVSRSSLPAGEQPRRTGRAKSSPRFMTTTPPASPPALVCPSCDSPLIYERSHVGGVSERQREQWDEFACRASCGVFQYRHRTRTVRRVV